MMGIDCDRMGYHIDSNLKARMRIPLIYPRVCQRICDRFLLSAPTLESSTSLERASLVRRSLEESPSQ